MRRTLAWLAGALGVAGLVRGLRQRPRPLPELGPDPRAEALKRRLDEARPLASQPVEEADAAETPVDEAPDPPSRTRADVHAQARTAIEEMRRGGAGPGTGADADSDPAQGGH
jgi:hypothetical protein